MLRSFFPGNHTRILLYVLSFTLFLAGLSAGVSAKCNSFLFLPRDEVNVLVEKKKQKFSLHYIFLYYFLILSCSIIYSVEKYDAILTLDLIGINLVNSVTVLMKQVLIFIKKRVWRIALIKLFSIKLMLLIHMFYKN